MSERMLTGGQGDADTGLPAFQSDSNLRGAEMGEEEGKDKLIIEVVYNIISLLSYPVSINGVVYYIHAG